MTRSCALTFFAFLVTVCIGAAPPSKKAAEANTDPEPRKQVYHRFLVIIATPQPSLDQLRKRMAPLELAKVTVPRPESMFRKANRKIPPRVLHEIYVRSIETYEKVEGIIKSKPGVVEVRSWPPPVKRTVDELPGPGRPDLPGTVYHYFNVNIDMPKRTHEDLQKLLAPLDLVQFRVPFTEGQFRERFSRPPEFLYYRLCIRSRESYEQVEGTIKAKPGVTLATQPDADKRTVKKLPKGTWLEQDPPKPKVLPKR
jgi:hypothetical protein